jgi:fluoride ion exporter CrcB/FEX
VVPKTSKPKAKPRPSPALPQSDAGVLRSVFALTLTLAGLIAATIQTYAVSGRPYGPFYPAGTLTAAVIGAFLFLFKSPEPRTKTGKFLRHPMTVAIAAAIVGGMTVWARP